MSDRDSGDREELRLAVSELKGIRGVLSGICAELEDIRDAVRRLSATYAAIDKDPEAKSVIPLPPPQHEEPEPAWKRPGVQSGKRPDITLAVVTEETLRDKQ